MLSQAGKGTHTGPSSALYPEGSRRPLPVPVADSCGGWGRVSRAGLGVGRNHPRASPASWADQSLVKRPGAAALPTQGARTPCMVEGHCLLRALLLCLASASSLSSEAEEQMERETPPDAKNPRSAAPQRNTESHRVCCAPAPNPHPSNKDPQLGLWAGWGWALAWPACKVAQLLPTRLEGKVSPKPPPCFPNGLSTAIRHITGVTRHLFLAWTETLL